MTKGSVAIAFAAAFALAAFTGGCVSSGVPPAPTTDSSSLDQTPADSIMAGFLVEADAVPTPIDPDRRPGFVVYRQHCAVCHGARGEGYPDWKIPRDDGLFPPPPHDSSGHTWHHSDKVLMEIIREGGKIYMPQSGMPGYADVLTEPEMVAALEYIKTLWGPEERSYQVDISRQEEFSSGVEEERSLPDEERSAADEVQTP